MSSFTYSTSSFKKFILPETDAVRISDDEVFNILNNPDCLDALTIAEIIIWISYNENAEKFNYIKKFITCRNYFVISDLLLKYWQNNYENQVLAGYISDVFTKYEKNFLYKKWNEWFTAENIPWIISGAAAQICNKENWSFQKFCSVYHLRSESRLGKKISVLFHCFCSEKSFVCSDYTLNTYISTMTNYEKYRFTRNFVSRFPLINDDGTLNNEHRYYTIKYINVWKNIISEKNDIWYYELISNYIAASEIIEKFHSEFWEYRFLQSQNSEKRLDYYKYQHIPEKNLFIVTWKTGRIEDYYAAGKIYIFHDQSNEKFELDTYSLADWQDALIKKIIIHGEKYYDK